MGVMKRDAVAKKFVHMERFNALKQRLACQNTSFVTLYQTADLLITVMRRKKNVGWNFNRPSTVLLGNASEWGGNAARLTKICPLVFSL